MIKRKKIGARYDDDTRLEYSFTTGIRVIARLLNQYPFYLSIEEGILFSLSHKKVSLLILKELNNFNFN